MLLILQYYIYFVEPIQLPTALWISKIKDLKHVPVPTADIKVDPTGNYSGISYISKFEPTFKLAGGINLPKIISCVGSDGKKSRQLVKVNVEIFTYMRKAGICSVR